MCKRIFSNQTSDTGEVPFYKIGTLGRIPDSYISKELFHEYKSKYRFPNIGETLISCSGTIGRCIKYDGKDAYFQDSNIVWLINDQRVILNDFLFYLIARYDWGFLNTTTIKRLFIKDLNNLTINYPQDQREQKHIVNLINTREQKHIVNLINTLSMKIRNIEDKINILKKYRKGLLKIVCKHGCVCLLGEVLREEIHKTKINNEHPIISSTSEGVFLQKDYFNHQVASNNNIGYKIIRKNQIVFSPQNLWLGNINLNDKYDVGCVSPSYKIYSFDTELIDPQFFIEYLKTPYMLYQYKLCSEQGASVVRRNLDLSSFLKLKIILPNLEIQKIIGVLKTHLDLLDRQLFLLRQIKSFLLQNMFI